jgi:hypothetical protein
MHDFFVSTSNTLEVGRYSKNGSRTITLWYDLTTWRWARLHPTNVHFWTADVVWGSKITPLTLKLGGVIQCLEECKNLRWYILQFCLNFHTSVDSQNSVFWGETDAPGSPCIKTLWARPIAPETTNVGRRRGRVHGRASITACRRAQPRKSRPQTCRGFSLI